MAQLSTESRDARVGMLTDETRASRRRRAAAAHRACQKGH